MAKKTKQLKKVHTNYKADGITYSGTGLQETDGSYSITEEEENFLLMFRDCDSNLNKFINKVMGGGNTPPSNEEHSNSLLYASYAEITRNAYLSHKPIIDKIKLEGKENTLNTEQLSMYLQRFLESNKEEAKKNLYALICILHLHLLLMK